MSVNAVIKRSKKLAVPEGVNLAVRWASTKRLLLEEPPGIERITYYEDSYLLPMPWRYYLINDMKTEWGWATQATHIVCSPKQLVENNDMVCHLPLPNIYDGERPCYYNDGAFFTEAQGPVGRGMGTIQCFKQSGFNADAINWACSNDTYKEMMTRTLGWTPTGEIWNYYREVLRYWENLSIEDVLALPYTQLRTVKDLLGSHAIHRLLRAPQ